MNNITVEEFMKQVGNSHLDIEPSVYGGAAMQISNASVSYDDEEEELTEDESRFNKPKTVRKKKVTEWEQRNKKIRLRGTLRKV